jgi:hypothetical protein
MIGMRTDTYSFVSFHIKLPWSHRQRRRPGCRNYYASAIACLWNCSIFYTQTQTHQTHDRYKTFMTEAINCPGSTAQIIENCSTHGTWTSSRVTFPWGQMVTTCARHRFMTGLLKNPSLIPMALQSITQAVADTCTWDRVDSVSNGEEL